MPHLTFIHGLQNKPPADELHELWVRALADGGLDVVGEGVSTSLVYWAHVLYAAPDHGDTTRDHGDGADPGLAWARGLRGEEAAFVEAMLERFEAELPPEAARSLREPGRLDTRAIPLPRPLERLLMRRLLRDAHHYLYDAESEPRPGERFRVRDELRSLLTRALGAVPDRARPHVVVAHSMGTMISYDCLWRVAGTPAVDGFVTLGSPLGLSEVQDGWGDDWSSDDAFPSQRVPRNGWLNVYEPLDPVCGVDPKLANDYQLGGDEVIDDVRVASAGWWRHSIGKYLRQPTVTDRLRTMLGL